MTISPKSKKTTAGDNPHLLRQLVNRPLISQLCTIASFQARKHELVIQFSGVTMVAEPNVMLASAMYVEEKTVTKQQDDSAGKGVSVIGVAFIAVFCTLAVVAVALVTFKVSVYIHLVFETFHAHCKNRKKLKIQFYTCTYDVKRERENWQAIGKMLSPGCKGGHKQTICVTSGNGLLIRNQVSLEFELNLGEPSVNLG